MGRPGKIKDLRVRLTEAYPKNSLIFLGVVVASGLEALDGTDLLTRWRAPVLLELVLRQDILELRQNYISHVFVLILYRLNYLLNVSRLHGCLYHLRAFIA